MLYTQSHIPVNLKQNNKRKKGNIYGIISINVALERNNTRKQKRKMDSISTFGNEHLFLNTKRVSGWGAKEQKGASALVTCRVISTGV